MNNQIILKKTKKEVLDIYTAIDVLGATKITSRMRYGVARCRACMKPVIEAIMDQIGPEPDLGEYRRDLAALQEGANEESQIRDALNVAHAEKIRAHEDWAKNRQATLSEETDVQIYKIPLECEIDDINLDAPQESRKRMIQNQAIVETLLDVWAAS
ncbi:MAG: hypothetical protein IT581_06445 [Verrucomicrobiales bacterium]|nr:hypothetical protein [Verrucomicrobiales bacterium]